MSGPGFFYSPEEQAQSQAIARQQALAQALMEQGGGNPGSAQYGGLRNAGNALLGAFLTRRGDSRAADLAKQAQGEYTTALGSLLRGAPAQGQGQQTNQNLDPEGNPAAATSPPQQGGGDDFVSRLIATGNPGLIQQFAPEIIKNRMAMEQKHITPISPEDAQAAHLRGVWGKDAAGNFVSIQQSDAKSPEAETQAIREHQQEQILTPEALGQKKEIERFSQAPQWAQLAESSRHNKVQETIAQNPFGVGTAGAINKTGPDFLAEIAKTNPGLAAQLTAVGTYRQPAPAGRTSPTGIKFMTMVNQAYPSYDASQYGSKVKARNDFATGKNGNTVRSLNVAVQHLDQLGQLSTAMANGDVQMVNKIGNYFATQTGGPAPSNFNAAKQIVGDEIVKAIIGAGGGVSDREEAAHNISAASSPQQLAGVIKTYQGLLSGQLVGLKRQYEKNTGLNDFEDFLAPETKAKLQAHGSGEIMPPGTGGGQTITPEQARAELARRRK